jgi:hypothetical protein
MNKIQAVVTKNKTLIIAENVLTVSLFEDGTQEAAVICARSYVNYNSAAILYLVSCMSLCISTGRLNLQIENMLPATKRLSTLSAVKARIGCPSNAEPFVYGYIRDVTNSFCKKSAKNNDTLA